MGPGAHGAVGRRLSARRILFQPGCPKGLQSGYAMQVLHAAHRVAGALRRSKSSSRQEKSEFLTLTHSRPSAAVVNVPFISRRKFGCSHAELKCRIGTRKFVVVLLY